jgi:hypothetical protein
MRYLYYFYNIGDIVGGIMGDDGLGGIINGIVDDITEAIADLFYKFFYAIVISVCEIIRLIYEVYGVFAGLSKVTYDGKSQYLINVFFENHTVSNIYMGMAFIGVALCFGAAMVAVIKKMFDGRDKDQRSMGGILGSLAKSLLLIFSMNFIILAFGSSPPACPFIVIWV